MMETVEGATVLPLVDGGVGVGVGGGVGGCVVGAGCVIGAGASDKRSYKKS